jgi:hypothetical protein
VEANIAQPGWYRLSGFLILTFPLAVLSRLPRALEFMITLGKSLFRSKGRNALVTIAGDVTALLKTVLRLDRTSWRS